MKGGAYARTSEPINLNANTVTFLLDKLDCHILNAPARPDCPSLDDTPWTPNRVKRQKPTKMTSEEPPPSFLSSPPSLIIDTSPDTDKKSSMSKITASTFPTPHSVSATGLVSQILIGTPTKASATPLYHIGGRIATPGSSIVRTIGPHELETPKQKDGCRSQPRVEPVAYGSCRHLLKREDATSTRKALVNPMLNGLVEPAGYAWLLRNEATALPRGAHVDTNQLGLSSPIITAIGGNASGSHIVTSKTRHGPECDDNGRCRNLDFKRVQSVEDYQSFIAEQSEHQKQVSPPKTVAQPGNWKNGIAPGHCIQNPESELGGGQRAVWDNAVRKLSGIPQKTCANLQIKHEKRPEHMIQTTSQGGQVIVVAINPFFFDPQCDHCLVSGHVIPLSPFFNPPQPAERLHFFSSSAEHVKKALWPKYVCTYHSYFVLTQTYLMVHEKSLLEEWKYMGRELPEWGSREYVQKMEDGLAYMQLLCGSTEDKDECSQSAVRATVAHLDAIGGGRVRMGHEADADNFTA